MTITDLLLNFRRALMGVVPSFDEVGVPWRRLDAHDDWDNLATALYGALVVEVIRSLLPLGHQEEFDLAPYDLLIPDYSTRSMIEIDRDVGDDPSYVFHAFGTASEPFDMVEMRELMASALPVDDYLHTRPVELVSFRLRLRLGNDERVLHDLPLSGRRLT